MLTDPRSRPQMTSGGGRTRVAKRARSPPPQAIRISNPPTYAAMYTDDISGEPVVADAMEQEARDSHVPVAEDVTTLPSFPPQAPRHRDIINLVSDTMRSVLELTGEAVVPAVAAAEATPRTPQGEAHEIVPSPIPPSPEPNSGEDSCELEERDRQPATPHCEIRGTPQRLVVVQYHVSHPWTDCKRCFRRVRRRVRSPSIKDPTEHEEE